MNNERKLELTLCGMLPYGLKCKFTTDEVYTLIGIVNKDLWLKELTYPADSFSCKPLLHSLDELTEPILEGGLIPINELWRMIKYEARPDIYNPNWLSRSFLSLETEPFWITEKLKEWHFNIYDLPKEMYIKKSTVNL